MNKYRFDKTKKREVLAGRTLTYIASDVVGKSKGYVTNILNGRLAINKNLVDWMIKKLDLNETYFIKEV